MLNKEDREKQLQVVTEFAMAAIFMVGIHMLTICFVNLAISYNCNPIAAKIIGVCFLFIVALYIIPTIMYKRYLNYVKRNTKPKELPNIVYHNYDGVPHCIDFKNSKDTKIHVFLFEDEARVYADNENGGSDIFSGNVNMCMREISKRWNNCGEYTMSIGIIYDKTGNEDIRPNELHNYKNFKFDLTESDNEVFEKKKEKEKEDFVKN